ncbi:SIMPL domain-containing protein [Oceanobacillus massiliensis]|uniref:SIMPL domain-containing protein n=1 Tax=Oceanobacillus massiliensis TaxID=1465765 RepID=UPI0002888123|nr:SIMPL domain-containing protein [Oceanobacillus massiliensis]
MYYGYYPPYWQSRHQALVPSPPARMLTVKGNGRVPVQPDIAIIQLEVLTEGESVTVAQGENARIMDQVIQALINLEVPRDDIQTTNFAINPRYDFVDGVQVFRGYEVRNEITVKISPIAQAGRIIDTAVQNGVNRVSNIRFSVEDGKVHYQEALSLALSNAIGKAEAIANAMQLDLDRIPVSIIEKEQPQPIRTFSVAAEGLSTPIEPGEMIVSAEVMVKFQY